MNIEHVHQINLIMLKAIDSFCRRHSISYRLEAGTLLGAIRHGGFIPWDDDCDVAFLRSEYEKFKEALKTDTLGDDIVYRAASDNGKYFHDFTDRIFYTKEVYREGDTFNDRFDGLYKYLWVDLFVIDNIPDNGYKNVFLKQKIIYGKAMGHRHEYNFTKHKGLMKNAAAIMLSSIGRFYKLSDIYKEQDSLSKKYSNLKDNKYLYYSNYPAIWMGYMTDRAMEEELIYVPFEDTKLPVLKDYDKLLRYFYGDYMNPPPKEKQIPEHKDNIW